MNSFMTDPKVLISQLREKFETNPLVEAFVLVGSQARDDVYTASKYSDMEAYVIAKDKDADALEKELPDLIRETGTIIFSFRHAIGFVAVYDDLFRLELPVIKESGLKGLFNRPKAQAVKVLVDNTGGKLEKILANRPVEIDYAKDFRDKVTNFWFWHILAIQYFKKGEFYNTRAVLGIHASMLIWMFELLNDPNTLLLETNKRIEQFLTKEQQKLLEEISPAYNQQQIEQSLRWIMEIVPQTTKSIKEKYGYVYDETLEEKVKPKLLELLG